MKSISAQLETAWELRSRQKVEGCLDILAELRLHTGIANSFKIADEVRRVLDAFPFADAISYLALEISVLRSQRQSLASMELLASVERTADSASLLRSFPFLFEKALTLFVLQSNYVEAMDYFLLASKFAPNNEKKAFALLNMILCLENSGLPYGARVEELKTLLASSEAAMPAVASQLKALEYRELFRTGRLSEIFSAGVDSQKFGQDSYYQLWVASLPYHCAPTEVHKDLELMIESSPYFVQKNFRIRTLLGYSHPEDLHQQKISEIVDRVYLWTWRFLLNPNATQLTKLLPALNLSALFDIELRGTNDDTFLLSNALLWLALFDSEQKDTILRLVARLQRSNMSSAPLLELEYLLLSYLHARQDNDQEQARNFSEQIGRHPLAKDEGVFLGQLFCAISGREAKLTESLRRLATYLREDVLADIDADRGIEVLVDLRKDVVLAVDTGDTVHSAPLVELLELLRAREFVSCEELLRKAYGIRVYDPIIHQVKVHNLVARAKHVLKGALKLKVRGERILSFGDWKQVQFAGSFFRELGLRNSSDWKSFCKRAEAAGKHVRLAPVSDELVHLHPSKIFTDKKVVTRQDMERRLRASKSTVTRLLNRWLADGILAKQGKGKRTVYTVRVALAS